MRSKSHCNVFYLFIFFLLLFIALPSWVAEHQPATMHNDVDNDDNDVREDLEIHDRVD